MKRRLALTVVGVTVGSLVASGAWVARGDTEATTTTAPPPSSTTSTTAAPASTTTAPWAGRQGPGDAGDQPFSPDAPDPTVPRSTAQPPAPPTNPDGSLAGDGAGEGVVPPDAVAQIGSIARSGPRNTDQLLALLAPLRRAGYGDDEIAAAGFGQFPVAGPARYSHDWWFPRFVPSFHLHEGTDVFAPFGTPAHAPFAGVVRRSSGAVGGQAVYVTRPDGTFAYLAHLQGFAPSAPDGALVAAGAVVGFVGDSGNARGGSPHVHFEYHPRGGAAVDPKPLLDRWLDEAEANAPAVVADLLDRRPGPGTTRVADARIVGRAAPARDDLLWASAVNPAGGAVHLAAAAAADAASGVRWGEESPSQRALLAERRVAEIYLSPLTPRILATALANLSG